MFNEDTYDRRRFIGTTAMTIAGARLGVLGVTTAHPTKASPEDAIPVKSSTNIPLGPIKLGYAEAGPANGPAVVLVHGWPYDIYSYADVVPLLSAKGYRVIVPFLRGHGSTRFLSAETFRNGEQAAIASDIIALMDALKIDKAVVGGFDWGARTAVIMAALWPQRTKAIVAVSGYIVTNLEANKKPLPPKAELGWWYQYYFATERGERGYTENRHDFNKLIWQLASPKWNFDDATYDRTAAAFNNPDHVSIVIHNYRWRLSLAKGEPRYEELEQKLFQTPVITVPTITIGSDFDGANTDGKAYAKLFSGKHSHRVLNGIGHNVPQEAPQAFADAIIEVDGY